MKRTKIKIGEKYSRLTIIEKVENYVSPSGKTESRFKCKCDCGNEKIAISGHLKSGRTQSCGCLNNEERGKRFTKYSTKHNLSKHELYPTYQGMKQRCSNPNHQRWMSYGGRGIKVEDCWLGENGFVNFLKDMGERPVGKTLDRIDNDGNYGLTNCRWATLSEQNKNRRK
jgi:hypothetical protein